MNRKISKLFIFLIAISMGMVKVNGAEVGQTVQTDVQPAVSVQKLPSTDSTSVTDVMVGTHSGIESNFSLETNDADYNFVVTSKVLVDGTEYSAFGNNGNSVLFVHTLASPTLSAIENAKVGGSDNKNVIAYPVDVNVSATDCEMTASYGNNTTYGDCYLITVDGIGTGTLAHKVGGTPIAGTYNVGQDQYGTYQSIVTVTAISK